MLKNLDFSTLFGYPRAHQTKESKVNVKQESRMISERLKEQGKGAGNPERNQNHRIEYIQTLRHTNIHMKQEGIRIMGYTFIMYGLLELVLERADLKMESGRGKHRNMQNIYRDQDGERQGVGGRDSRFQRWLQLLNPTREEYETSTINEVRSYYVVFLCHPSETTRTI